MNEQIEINPKLLEAFELMWGAYPGPASLVHRSKTIMAANAVCQAGGRTPGMKCSAWVSPDNHRGCQAERTLREQIPCYKEVRKENGVWRVYWLPIPGHPDFYIHFTTQTLTIEPRGCGG